MDRDKAAARLSFGKDCKLPLVNKSLCLLNDSLGNFCAVLPDLIRPVSGGFSFVPSGLDLVRFIFFHITV